MTPSVQPPRFSEPRRERPADTDRYAEYAALSDRRSELAALMAALLRGYGRWAPDAIERAYDVLAEADDLLAKRQSILDDETGFGDE